MTPRGTGRPAPGNEPVVVATPDQRAQIVRALADGVDREVVAQRMRLPFDTVMRVAVAHGYPRRASLATAASILEGLTAGDRLVDVTDQAIADAEARGCVCPVDPWFPVAECTVANHADLAAADARRGKPRHLPRTFPSGTWPGGATVALPGVPLDAAPVTHIAYHTAPSPRSRPGSVGELLALGEASPDPDTVSAAHRAREVLADLKARVDGDLAAERFRADVAPAEAEVDQPVARFEVGPPSVDLRRVPLDRMGLPPAREIRAWALDNGVACPRAGRPPFTVLSAYAEAHDITLDVPALEQIARDHLASLTPNRTEGDD